MTFLGVMVMDKLDREFFLRDTLIVAKELIGKYIIKEELIVRVTETEAYIGDIDKACHAYGRKRTNRTETLFMEGGAVYVYLIYGMYYCLNFVTEEEGNPCAVLIRGVEPIEGLDTMSNYRYSKPYEQLNSYQKKNFSNGPGKLCKALNIDKSLDKTSLINGEINVFENKDEKVENIKTGKRINIDYAEEAKDFLWRYYV